MLGHAVCLLNRFQLHASDSQTSFQRRWSTAYSTSVLPFGELVLAQDQNLAIWLARCEVSDDHTLANANSISLAKSRTVTRLRELYGLYLVQEHQHTTTRASAAYLKMAKLGDPPIAKARGERELRMVSPPQACNNPLQQKAKGRQSRSVSFQLPPGLAQPPSTQACPYELPDLAWQQPALQQPCELQPTALHQPVVQQPASATTALIEQVIEPTSRRPPFAKQASQHQFVRSRMKQKGSSQIASKLHSILEKHDPSKKSSLQSMLQKKNSDNHKQWWKKHSFELTSKMTSACSQQRSSRKLSWKKVRAWVAHTTKCPKKASPHSSFSKSYRQHGQ